MSDDPRTMRVLFCGAVLQNFFDLPSNKIMEALKGAGALIKGIRETQGIHVLGTLDDDETMVGTSPDGYPWTFYILAEATDRSAVVAACNLLRTIEVGDRKLWSYIRLEARLGREIEMPEPE